MDWSKERATIKKISFEEGQALEKEILARETSTPDAVYIVIEAKNKLPSVEVYRTYELAVQRVEEKYYGDVKLVSGEMLGGLNFLVHAFSTDETFENIVCVISGYKIVDSLEQVKKDEEV